MLVACRLAGLSALGAYYAGVKWHAIRGRLWLRGLASAWRDARAGRELQRRDPAAGRDGGEGAVLTGLVAHKLI